MTAVTTKPIWLDGPPRTDVRVERTWPLSDRTTATLTITAEAVTLDLHPDPRDQGLRLTKAELAAYREIYAEALLEFADRAGVEGNVVSVERT